MLLSASFDARNPYFVHMPKLNCMNNKKLILSKKKTNVLPVVCLDGGVIVLLGELHVVDEIRHVLAQHLVGHLNLQQRMSRENLSV